MALHTSIVQRACDTLLWHPQCPDMPKGTEGLAYAMEAALEAVRPDLEAETLRVLRDLTTALKAAQECLARAGVTG